MTLTFSDFTTDLSQRRGKPSPPLPSLPYFPSLPLPSLPSPILPSLPLPLEVGPLESSSPSGVWGEAPAANDFGAF